MPVKVLVTGATGFLGGRLVKRLLSDGYEVRALARVTADVSALSAMDVEIVFGDVSDGLAVAGAMKNVEIVVHAAAGTSGTAEDAERSSILGTENIVEACRSSQVRKLIYISSCAVYEVARCTANEVITEEGQLERFPWRRGAYSAGKLGAENVVRAAMKATATRYSTVVLRPGSLYGPGASAYSNMMGISLGYRLFVVFGSGESEMPLLYVDNAIDAIVASIASPSADNQVFNVVDPQGVTKSAYMDRVIRRMYPEAVIVYLPLVLLLAAVRVQEWLMGVFRKRPVLSVYRVLSSQTPVRYSTARIQRTIGWTARVAFEEGSERMVRCFKKASARPEARELS